MKFILYKGDDIMAHEYKKLSEVEVIDVADSSVNLIVETNDEIKKLNIDDLPIGGQEQADWNEEDETKPSFIKNKPDLSQVGGSSGGEVIVINTDKNFLNADWHYADGTVITPESLRDKLEAGAQVYIKRPESGLSMHGNLSGDVLYKVNRFYYVPPYTNLSGFPSSSETNLFIIRRGSNANSVEFGLITCYGD